MASTTMGGGTSEAAVAPARAFRRGTVMLGGDLTAPIGWPERRVAGTASASRIIASNDGGLAQNVDRGGEMDQQVRGDLEYDDWSGGHRQRQASSAEEFSKFLGEAVVATLDD
ncbi:hypothetical protein ACP70R_008131 [Stipagrostis hirtigluma subsp. patula]